MSEAEFRFAKAMRVGTLLCAGLTLIGCQSIREATGAAKLPPDEFTVLTKAPLVLPPDYNLRPPQPGLASRAELVAEEQARSALFTNTADQAAALGTAYSDGEKLLLTRSGALAADPGIRRTVTNDVGLEDQGPAFAQQVLYPQTATAAAAVPAASAVAAGAGTAASDPVPSAESVLFPQTNTTAATEVPAPAAAPRTAEEPATAAAQTQENRPWWKRSLREYF